MKKSRFFDLALCAFFLAALIAVLLSVGGCACFKSGKVEARASYNVIARDCDVSLVAVGYVRD